MGGGWGSIELWTPFFKVLHKHTNLIKFSQQEKKSQESAKDNKQTKAVISFFFSPLLLYDIVNTYLSGGKIFNSHTEFALQLRFQTSATTRGKKNIYMQQKKKRKKKEEDIVLYLFKMLKVYICSNTEPFGEEESVTLRAQYLICHWSCSSLSNCRDKAKRDVKTLLLRFAPVAGGSDGTPASSSV